MKTPRAHQRLHRTFVAAVAIGSAAVLVVGCTRPGGGGGTPTVPTTPTPTTPTPTTAPGGEHGGGEHGGGEHGGHESPERLNHPPTAEQKAWAFEFVKSTNNAIKNKTVCAAEQEGYVNIGDSQHWTNGRYRNDGKNFEPTAIESLVFPRGTSCQRTSTATPEAAMYNVEPGTNLNNIKDYAGNWFVYHGHDTLCWATQDGLGRKLAPSDPGYWKLALCAPTGTGEKREPVPMVHLWIKDTPTAKECGVFASIEGLGPGSCFPQLVPSKIIAGTLQPAQV